MVSRIRRIFGTTSEKLSDIKTKSVIETFLFSQILAKFENGTKKVATTLTLRIYFLMK